MLCTFCKEIKPPDELGPEHGKEGHFCLIRHHASFSDLASSAKEGCELCALFARFVEEVEDDNESEMTFLSSLDDPFEDSDVDEWEAMPKYRVDSDVYYADGGHRYWRYYDSWAPARRAEYMDLEENSDDEEIREYHPSEHNEFLHWLVSCSGTPASSEQIWVSIGHIDAGNDKDWIEVETNLLVKFSAGSLPLEVIEEGSSYCVDGFQVPDQRSLALKEPTIFTQRRRNLAIIRDDGGSMPPDFEFFLKNDHTKGGSSSIVARSVAQNADSEECFNLMREWLSDCRKSHRLCPTPDSKKYPARLIKVGKDESYDPHLVSTASSDKTNHQYEYIILSYCWGPKATSARLLKSNIDAMYTSLGDNKDVRNFQDSIKIARQLKIPYLWIDALCIIQDSMDDWASESSRMAEYYSNAQVTISALSSPSVSSGILNARGDSSIAIKANVPGQDVFIRPVLEDILGVVTHEDMDYSQIRPRPLKMPLNKRSWTLQERIFSNRILHFTNEQIFWQCKRCLVSEDKQYTLPSHSTGKARLKDLIHLPKNAYKKVKRSRKPTVDDTGWYDAVKDYTGRELKFHSDKLPAISSLAKAVGNATGAKYLAGLWYDVAEDLIYNLLWAPFYGHLEYEANGSPTWSWSSMKGAVDFLALGMELAEDAKRDPKFHSVRTDPTTVNPFGQVSLGRIEIEGWTRAYSGPNSLDHLYPQKQKLIEMRKRLEEAMASDSTPGSGLSSLESDDEDSSDQSTDSSSEGTDSDKDDSDSDEGSSSGSAIGKSHSDSKGSASDADSESAWSDSDSDGFGRSDLSLPFGRKDVHDPSYDWDAHPHIVLFMGKYDPQSDDELSDDESEYGGPKQFFLILRLTGLTSFYKTRNRKGGKYLSGESSNRKENAKAVNDERLWDDPDWRNPVGTWVRVGVAQTGEFFPQLKIEEKEGWKKQKLVLL